MASKKMSNKKVVEPKQEEIQSVKVVVDSSSHDEDTNYGISGREGMLESNEVYDEADIASAVERGLIAQALANHRQKIAPETHPDFDGEHCVDCDILIPEGRLKLFKVRCVDCQSELEKYNKIHGR